MMIDLEGLRLAIQIWIGFGVGLYALISVCDR